MLNNVSQMAQNPQMQNGAQNAGNNGNMNGYMTLQQAYTNARINNALNNLNAQMMQNNQNNNSLLGQVYDDVIKQMQVKPGGLSVAPLQRI